MYDYVKQAPYRYSVGYKNEDGEWIEDSNWVTSVSAQMRVMELSELREADFSAMTQRLARLEAALERIAVGFDAGGKFSADGLRDIARAALQDE